MLFELALSPSFKLQELYYNILCEKIYVVSALIPNKTHLTCRGLVNF